MERKPIIIPAIEREEELRSSFADKLLRTWKQMHPEAFVQTVPQERENRASLQLNEQIVQDHALSEALIEYGISPKAIRNIGSIEMPRYLEEEPEQEQVFVIPVREHFTMTRLPKGYGYKGGAARALLLRSLGVDRVAVPRDLDVVRLAEKEPYPGADVKVAQEFMPEDVAFGHGTEVLNDRNTYFATRDLTINEVLASDTQIFATRQCIMDTVRHVIRPTEYERGEFNHGNLGPKMLAKLLRFYAQAVEHYDNAALEDVEGWEFETYFISPFYLAVQLDKAYEESEEDADAFTRELVKRHQLPEKIESAEEAANYLLKRMRKRAFFYRHAPVGQFQMEDGWSEEQERHFEHLPHKASMRMGHKGIGK